MIRDTFKQDVVISGSGRGAKYIKYALISCVVLVVIWLSVAAFSSISGVESSISEDSVTLSSVERGYFVRDVSASGIVVATDRPTLYSSAFGNVNTKVKAGDVVKEGQVVARVNSPELLSTYRVEKARLSSLSSEIEGIRIKQKKQQLIDKQNMELAELNLKAAKREMLRSEKLKELSVISDIKYRRAADTLSESKVRVKHIYQEVELSTKIREFELESKEHELNQQSLLVEELARRVGALEMRSPIKGIVGKVFVKQGNTVKQNEPVISVIDLSAFEVEVAIPEYEASELDIGMGVEVEIGDKVYGGAVAAISPEVKNSEVIARVKFNENPPENIRQNQRVSARVIIEQKENALKVKRGRFYDNLSNGVYVVEDGYAVRRNVTFGSSNVSSVEVLSGLKPGERIIISDVGKFDNAEKVALH